MKSCDPEILLREFGFSTTAELLSEAAVAMLLAAESPDEEAVHRMRVSIRRFQQSLRLFSSVLREKGVKRVRRELKSVMEPAGELRNHDIAIQLVRGAKASTAALQQRRAAAREQFLAALRTVAQADLQDRWREALDIPA